MVLGCTHYVFIRDLIARRLPPGTPVLDGNAGTARQLARVLRREGLAALPGSAQEDRVVFCTSADPKAAEPIFRRLLSEPIEEY